MSGTKNNFAEYVTSTAFSISLSKNMVRMLLAQYESEVSGNREAVINELGSAFMAPLQALGRRGLVYWKFDPVKKCNTGCYLTEAGKLMIPLLLEAGYQLPSQRLVTEQTEGE